MFKLFSSAAAAGSMVGHRHGRQERNQMDQEGPSQHQHHMAHHQSHGKSEDSPHHMAHHQPQHGEDSEHHAMRKHGKMDKHGKYEKMEKYEKMDKNGKYGKMDKYGKHGKKHMQKYEDNEFERLHNKHHKEHKRDYSDSDSDSSSGSDSSDSSSDSDSCSDSDCDDDFGLPGHPLAHVGEFVEKLFSHKPVTKETYLGHFGDKKDQFMYGGWKTYIQQLALEGQQDCLHQSVVNDMDFALAFMELWKGNNQLRLQGASRMVDAIFTSFALKKSCLVPTKEETKIMVAQHNQGLKRAVQGKIFSDKAIKANLMYANELRKNQDYAMAGQYVSLAYLSWTGFEIDYATLPKTFVAPVEETPLNMKGTEIIGGLLNGLFDTNTMATVNEECFPELGDFVQQIEDGWSTMNTYIVGDIEEGYLNMVKAVANLPQQLTGCAGYTEDMIKLNAWMVASGQGEPEFADELHEYMVEHAWDADLTFVQALNAYVKPEWTSFGVALGKMMQ